jgi:hypothetical protein
MLEEKEHGLTRVVRHSFFMDRQTVLNSDIFGGNQINRNPILLLSMEMHLY